MPDGPADGHDRVYAHGYAVRLEVCLTASEYTAFVDHNRLLDGRLWKDRSERVRKNKALVRRHRAGSVSLTGRAPRNAGLGLSKQNKDWGTRIYGLVVEEAPEAMSDDDCERLGLLVYGVRADDVKVIAAGMGLRPHQWAVAGWEQVEQYIVISGPDAWRASAVLDGAHRRATRGPRVRKEFLVEDYPLPVSVATRASATALVSVYKVHLGATATWKMEAVLRADRHRHLLLGPEAAQTLKKALKEFADGLDLNLLEKPARWEPYDASDLDYHGPGLGPLWGKTYRGSKPGVRPASALRNFSDLRLVESPGIPMVVEEENRRPGVSVLLPPATGGHPDGNLSASISPAEEETADLNVHDLLMGCFGVALTATIPSMDDLVQGEEVMEVEVPDPDRRAGALVEGVGVFGDHPKNQPLVLQNMRLSSALSSMMKANPPLLRPRSAPSWAVKIADDIADLPEGWLVEVITDADIGVDPIVRGLAERLGSRVSLRFLGLPHRVPFGMAELMCSGRHSGLDAEVLVVAVDETVDPGLSTWFTEELCTVLSTIGKDTKVVLVSCLTGGDYWHPSPRNMESTLTAGKYYSNTRYRLDLDNERRVDTVHVVKDERHGRSGRRLWARWGHHVPVADADLEHLFDEAEAASDDEVIEFDLAL